MGLLDWLLDTDPAIRWQVMRDLQDADGRTVAAERAKVATQGWGANLLRLQRATGDWGEGPDEPAWSSTTFTLLLLRHFGVDPQHPAVRVAVDRVRDNVRFVWTETDSSPLFEGEVEACINGMALRLAAYFGELGPAAERLVDRLLREQLEDGGWNCEAPEHSSRSSFASTLAVLEGLLEYERVTGTDPRITAARLRGEEYLLERGLFRSLRTGEVVNPHWLEFSFPPRWDYDILRALDYLRESRPPDERCGEAIQVLLSKRDDDGRWSVENGERGGELFFAIDDGADSEPSRWNTLRALRVLRWWEQGLRD
ncbi:hypothetical protein ACFSBZ_08375 [Amnibacterium flavum]|uniref:Squalene cyclase n=1 Tax=Amnibacterium flavum TaxID=2173173 RepID=A0A2V1HLF4_9MICO|nr:hypothetical protein [Amnibacterium flavum]PVZ93388.1 hypothetical protein DDQ50_15550 [Amnibacterium flavum]